MKGGVFLPIVVYYLLLGSRVYVFGLWFLVIGDKGGEGT